MPMFSATVCEWMILLLLYYPLNYTQPMKMKSIKSLFLFFFACVCVCLCEMLRSISCNLLWWCCIFANWAAKATASRNNKMYGTSTTTFRLFAQSVTRMAKSKNKMKEKKLNKRARRAKETSERSKRKWEKANRWHNRQLCLFWSAHQIDLRFIYFWNEEVEKASRDKVEYACAFAGIILCS